jgi:hypothetical protein
LNPAYPLISITSYRRDLYYTPARASSQLISLHQLIPKNDTTMPAAKTNGNGKAKAKAKAKGARPSPIEMPTTPSVPGPKTPKTPQDEAIAFFSGDGDGEPVQVWELLLEDDGGPSAAKAVSKRLAACYSRS